MSGVGTVASVNLTGNFTGNVTVNATDPLIAGAVATPFWLSTEMLAAIVGAVIGFGATFLIYRWTRRDAERAATEDRERRRKVLLTNLAWEAFHNLEYLRPIRRWFEEEQEAARRAQISNMLATISALQAFMNHPGGSPPPPGLVRVPGPGVSELYEYIRSDLTTRAFDAAWTSPDTDLNTSPNAVLFLAAYSMIPIFRNTEEAITANLNLRRDSEAGRRGANLIRAVGRHAPVAIRQFEMVLTELQRMGVDTAAVLRAYETSLRSGRE